MNAIHLQLTTNEPFIYNNIPYHEGLLSIKQFQEPFLIPLDHWSIGDYQQQWIEGLERIHYESTSCIVTAVQDPDIRPLINWWVLYKQFNKIYIRNELLIGYYYHSVIGEDVFTPENCYDFIGTRQEYFDETIQIAEWVVEISSEAFDNPANIQRRYFA